MPLKKSKSSGGPKTLPADMENAIRDYNKNRNKIKEKVFEGESKPKVKKTNKKNNSKKY